MNVPVFTNKTPQNLERNKTAGNSRKYKVDVNSGLQNKSLCSVINVLLVKMGVSLLCYHN